MPAYEVRDGIMYVTADDGWTFAMPVRKFRLAMARAERALATYEAKKAEVVPLRRKGKGGEQG